MKIDSHRLSKRVNLLRRRWFSVFLINLTLYIALVNSFALFVLYPAVKHHRALMPLLVYLFISSPVLLYGLIMSKQARISRQTVIGLLIVALALCLRVATSNEATKLIVSSTIVYVLTAFVEESLWRGLLWRSILAKSKSRWQTYACVTLHFTVLHIPFACLRTSNAPLFLLGVTVLGLVLGGLRILGNSARLPVYAHAAVNILAKT